MQKLARRRRRKGSDKGFVIRLEGGGGKGGVPVIPLLISTLLLFFSLKTTHVYSKFDTYLMAFLGFFHPGTVLQDSLALVSQVIEVDVIVEVLEEPIVVCFLLVPVLGAVQWLQNLFDPFCRVQKVIMRDSGEEEVVRDVAVSDVVHQCVQSESPSSVDSLGLATNKRPFISLVHLNVLILMLQICDDDQDESLEREWNVVVLNKIVHRVTAEDECKVCAYCARQSGDDAFDSVRVIVEQSAPWPEMGTVWQSDYCVDWVPSQPSGQREACKVLLDEGSVVEVLFSDPWVSAIFDQVSRVLVVLSVRLLPRPVRSQDWGVCQMTAQIVQPFVVREASVAAVVADDEEGAADETEHPVPGEQADPTEVALDVWQDQVEACE